MIFCLEADPWIYCLELSVMKTARAEDENMFCSCSNKLSSYLGFLSGLMILDNKLFLCHG